MIKILFVCTGNICRSPTAHGILRDRLIKTGLATRAVADSAATHAYHVGEPPDKRSIATAKKHGIDISDLRARQVAPADFAEANVIAAMEDKHHRHLLGLCPPGLEGRIRPLMSFVPGSARLNVPDPYSGDDSFDQVFAMITAGVDGLLDHLRQTLLTDAG
ncbi:MAG TPA: low molecular weight phosphotyrosine protein phosphatase [Rhodospirillaceae bacterium]|nr:low molecular weight phosphotyrosine protein phosphatase [Rhodospirillaceae bacterium]